MNKELKKAAEILVECKLYLYGEEVLFESEWNIRHYIPPMQYQFHEIVNPFEDTLEGRRQADAIEDWLVKNKKHLWLSSMGQFGFDDIPKRQWRLDRIKWCLEKLVGEQP